MLGLLWSIRLGVLSAIRLDRRVLSIQSLSQLQQVLAPLLPQVWHRFDFKNVEDHTPISPVYDTVKTHSGSNYPVSAGSSAVRPNVFQPAVASGKAHVVRLEVLVRRLFARGPAIFCQHDLQPVEVATIFFSRPFSSSS
jgi:hypothetical protein